MCPTWGSQQTVILEPVQVHTPRMGRGFGIPVGPTSLLRYLCLPNSSYDRLAHLSSGKVCQLGGSQMPLFPSSLRGSLNSAVQGAAPGCVWGQPSSGQSAQLGTWSHPLLKPLQAKQCGKTDRLWKEERRQGHTDGQGDGWTDRRLPVGRAPWAPCLGEGSFSALILPCWGALHERVGEL